jgi:hypothetical protein
MPAVGSSGISGDTGNPPCVADADNRGVVTSLDNWNLLPPDADVVVALRTGTVADVLIFSPDCDDSTVMSTVDREFADLLAFFALLPDIVVSMICH